MSTLKEILLLLCGICLLWLACWAADDGYYAPCTPYCPMAITKE